MKTTDYTELDSAILARLARSPLTLAWLHAHEVRAETERIASVTGRDEFRVLDSRLQALRRAGKIAFSHRDGWALAAAEGQP